MKQKTEKVLSAYSAAIAERLTHVPEADDMPELTDEQLDQMCDLEADRPETPVSPVYQAACDLLEAIKAECGIQSHAEEPERWVSDAEDELIVKGLTTEINRSTSLVSTADTMENIAALFARHPHGYKYGSRDSKGRVLNEPFTASENEDAEKWMQSLKNGTAKPIVEDEGE